MKIGEALLPSIGKNTQYTAVFFIWGCVAVAVPILLLMLWLLGVAYVKISPSITVSMCCYILMLAISFNYHCTVQPQMVASML